MEGLIYNGWNNIIENVDGVVQNGGADIQWME